MKVEFTVPGKPLGKQRPRSGGGHRMYTPAPTVNYEMFVRELYTRDCLDENGKVQWFDDVPLRITIVAHMLIPSSTSKVRKVKMLAGELKPTKKPDIDNIAKIILDGLNGVAYYDDKQVVELYVEKKFGEREKVVVTIKEIEA